MAEGGTGHLGVMRGVLLDEARALEAAAARLDGGACGRLAALLDGLLERRAQLVFCGVGKSGHVGVKLAATFSSLGLRSLFLHPTEALHGDLGRVGPGDAAVLLSKSGATEELLALLPFLGVPRERLVAMVGSVRSPVARACGTVLDCSVAKEACINDQAPTTSTTLALAMGDAMAVLFEHRAGVKREDFGRFHPGGVLGRTLRWRVRDLMVPAGGCPTVRPDDTLKDAICRMTRTPLGACAVLGPGGALEGVVVEGDIRRALDRRPTTDQAVREVMTASPVTVGADERASAALGLMEGRERPIGVLPVVGGGGLFEGLVTLHALVRAGLPAGGPGGRGGGP